MECSICFENGNCVINRCETPNCNYPMCNKCWNLYYVGNVLTMTTEEFDSDGSKKCPACRQIYWKTYMRDVVHCELIQKVLGSNALAEWIVKTSPMLNELLVQEE